MTAPPQFPMPQGWGAQPPAPAQQFAQAPGGYAPPQQPQFPQQFQAPAAPMPGMYAVPPGYPPAGLQQVPPNFGQPPQQFGYDPYAQAQPQAPAFTPEGGTLDEYVGQRETGAQFWKFPNPGITRIGMVERELRDTDVRQVSFQGRPVQRMDGSVSQEKSLCIPIVEQDGQKYVWEVKGHVRTKLTEVVRAAGVESGIPEGGSMLRVTFTHRENVGTGGAQRKVLAIQYARPNQVQGGAPAQQPAAAPQPDLQYATPVPGAQQYAQPAMQSPPVAPQQPAQDPAYAAWLASQQQNGQAPQQAAPAQQFPPQAAFTPPAQPAPVPSPTPAGAYPAAAQQPGSQGPPAPQPYAPPGMDPAAAQMFANLVGGAAPQ